MTSKNLNRYAIILSCAVALTLAPISPLNLLLPGGSVAFAKNNNRDNGGGNSGDRGNSQSDNGGSSKSSERSQSSGNSRNSGSNSKSSTKSSGNSGRSASSQSGSDTHQSSDKSAKQNSGRSKDVALQSAPVPQFSVKRNLNAELGGLNSLKRNINGLMNSSDPRMDGIRAFIIASAESEQIQLQLADVLSSAGAAETALIEYFTTAFADLGGDISTLEDLSLEGVQARLDVLNATVPLEGDPEFEAWTAEVETLTLALEALQNDTTLATLQDELAAASGKAVETQALADELAAATDEQSLIEALLLASNPNRVAAAGDAYISPEIIAWANEILGVDELNGLIDAYLASIADSAEVVVEEPAPVDETIVAPEPDLTVGSL